MCTCVMLANCLCRRPWSDLVQGSHPTRRLVPRGWRFRGVHRRGGAASDYRKRYPSRQYTESADSFHCFGESARFGYNARLVRDAPSCISTQIGRLER